MKKIGIIVVSNIMKNVIEFFTEKTRVIDKNISKKRKLYNFWEIFFISIVAIILTVVIRDAKAINEVCHGGKKIEILLVILLVIRLLEITKQEEIKINTSILTKKLGHYLKNLQS